MLSAILRSDVAINVSIGIMRAFVEMQKFLATNSLILKRIDDLEVKQLEYQKSWLVMEVPVTYLVRT